MISCPAQFLDRAKSGVQGSNAFHAVGRKVQAFGDPLGYALAAAEQEYLEPAARGGARFERVEQVGPGEPSADRQAQQPGDPDNRHAVDQAEIALQQRFAKLGVGAACHQEVDIGRRNQERLAGADGGDNVVQQGLNIERVKGNAENAIDRPAQIALDRHMRRGGELADQLRHPVCLLAEQRLGACRHMVLAMAGNLKCPQNPVFRLGKIPY